MKYVGSKRRIAKELLSFFQPYLLTSDAYVEPFVGGCNMLEVVNHPQRIASDTNSYLISLLRFLQDGGLPSDPIYVGESQYKKIRDNKHEYEDWFVGYVGFNSYGGKFFGGYRRDSAGKRDYWAEHHKHLHRQQSKLMGVQFFCCDYTQLDIPRNSLVYLDPPYAHTLGYGSIFDSEKLFEWASELKKQGNTVFISEYECPFRCVWQRTISNTLVRDTGSKLGTEKLFVV